jgi:AraC family transcriptional regulator
MSEQTQVRLEEPRFEEGGPMVLAGLSRVFTWSEMGEIPTLWNEFGPRIGSIPGEVGEAAYGVNMAPPAEGGDFGYMAAVEVSDGAPAPADLTQVRLPAQRYAVFPHHGHVTELPGTIGAIMNEWLPQSGHRSPEVGPGGVVFLERYSEQFDPETGRGGMEVWMPIERS